MIKAVIFDCFGVLAGLGYKQIYHQSGGNLDKDGEFIDDLLTAANRGMLDTQELHQQVANRLGVSYEEWYDTLEKGEQPNEALFEYLDDLKKRGLKLAILSNAGSGTMERKFSPQQLQLFDTIVVSADVGALKPDRAIYELTAQRLAVQPAECLFVDDHQHYCEAAQATGMQAIFFQNTTQFKKDLEARLAQNT